MGVRSLPLVSIMSHPMAGNDQGPQLGPTQFSYSTRVARGYM